MSAKETENLDCYVEGVYAVIDPSGKVICETVSPHGHTAHSTFVHKVAHQPWSVCVKHGYRLARLEVVEIEVPPNCQTTKPLP